MGNGILPLGATGSPDPSPTAAKEGASAEAKTLDERQRLILAGVQEMADKGSEDPRVADIVRRAGLSNKAFYRNFKSKDELLYAVLEESMRLQVEQLVAGLEPGAKPLERVRAWILGVLELAIDPELSAAQRPLLVHQGRLLDSLGAETWGHVVRMMSLLQAAIRDAREAGDVPETVDPVLDAEAIFHLSLGWMSGRVIGRVVPTWEEAERVVAFALRGLGGRGPEA